MNNTFLLLGGLVAAVLVVYYAQRRAKPTAVAMKGKTVAVGYSDGAVEVNGELVGTLMLSSITCLVFHPTKNMLMVCARETILFDLDTRRVISTWMGTQGEFSENGEYAMSYTPGKSALIWDGLFVGNGVLNATILGNHLLCTIQNDGTMRGWQLKTGQQRKLFKLDPMPMSLVYTAFGGLYVYPDGSANLVTDTEVYDLCKHMTCFSLSQDRKTLAAAFPGNVVRVFDLETRSLRRWFYAPATVTAICTNGTDVLTIGTDGLLHGYDCTEGDATRHHD